MSLNQSLKLGKLFGIKLAIHWSFLLLIVWIVISSLKQGYSPSEVFWAIAFVLSIFLCVILHELGHALAAKKYGYNTKSIILLPIGGVANLEKIPEEPKQELVVAIAGPIVNIIIAFFLYLILIMTNQLSMPVELSKVTQDNFLIALLSVNVTLVIFNLIPAFPMDGGRVLRALLAFKLNRVRATSLAVIVGRVFAVLFMVYGFYGNPMLIFIGIFIFIGAQSELDYIVSVNLLKGYKVKDILMTDFKIIPPMATLKDVVSILLNGQDESFIVSESDHIMGVVTKLDVIKGLSQYDENVEVTKVMNPKIIQLSPEMSVQEAYEVMVKNNYSILPVIYNNKLIGVLDLENIYEFMMIKSSIKTKHIN
jgi:Zn-dependent protease/predicted transcriptional regulator